MSASYKLSAAAFRKDSKIRLLIWNFSIIAPIEILFGFLDYATWDKCSDIKKIEIKM